MRKVTITNRKFLGINETTRKAEYEQHQMIGFFHAWGKQDMGEDVGVVSMAIIELLDGEIVFTDPQTIDFNLHTDHNRETWEPK